MSANLSMHTHATLNHVADLYIHYTTCRHLRTHAHAAHTHAYMRYKPKTYLHTCVICLRVSHSLSNRPLSEQTAYISLACAYYSRNVALVFFYSHVHTTHITPVTLWKGWQSGSNIPLILAAYCSFVSCIFCHCNFLLVRLLSASLQ